MGAQRGEGRYPALLILLLSRTGEPSEAQSYRKTKAVLTPASRTKIYVRTLTFACQDHGSSFLETPQPHAPQACLPRPSCLPCPPAAPGTPGALLRRGRRTAR